MHNLIAQAHEEWHELLSISLDRMDLSYLQSLNTSHHWLPGNDALFAAFRLPLTATRYILLGESPYPRAASANGYAFWDASVGSLWSETGFSKEVNRATSLRNLMKMLLHARGDLSTDFSQSVIAGLDKSIYVQTAAALFNALLNNGFLLLNASLVFSEGQVPYHARHWRPFFHELLNQLAKQHPDLQLVLFGKIAEKLPKTTHKIGLLAEHPYNISFITNKDVLAFFKPLNLLAKEM